MDALLRLRIAGADETKHEDDNLRSVHHPIHPVEKEEARIMYMQANDAKSDN